MMNTIFYLAFSALCFVLLICFLDWLQSLTSDNSDLHPKDDPNRPRQVQLKPEKKSQHQDSVADYLRIIYGKTERLGPGQQKFYQPPTNTDGSVKFRNDSWRKDSNEG